MIHIANLFLSFDVITRQEIVLISFNSRAEPFTKQEHSQCYCNIADIG